MDVACEMELDRVGGLGEGMAPGCELTGPWRMTGSAPSGDGRCISVPYRRYTWVPKVYMGGVWGGRARRRAVSEAGGFQDFASGCSGKHFFGPLAFMVFDGT